MISTGGGSLPPVTPERNIVMDEAAPRKWITLTERVDINGEVRRPEERAILVDGERAAELLDAGQAIEATEPIPGGEDLVGRTVEDLRATAQAEQVDLHGAKRKADIVDAIVEHRQEPEGE